MKNSAAFTIPMGAFQNKQKTVFLFIRTSMKMARIEIDTTYKKYLDSLVKAGFFQSVTAAAEATIHKQMVEDEKMRLSSVALALAKGEANIKAGRTVRYTSDLITEISEKGKRASINKHPVKQDVRG
jgi:hypothetical protein